MILEYGKKQYECLHTSWEKVVAVDETYWRCECGATNEIPTNEKTTPTPIPEYMKGIE